MIILKCDRCGNEKETESITSPIFPIDTKYVITKIGDDEKKGKVIYLCPNCEKAFDNFLKFSIEEDTHD